MAGVRTEDSIREFEGKMLFALPKQLLSAVALQLSSSLNTRAEHAAG